MTRRGTAVALSLTTALSISTGAERQTGRSPQAARRLAILALEDSRAPTAQDTAALVDAARAQDPAMQAVAVRALGRLERRDVITDLIGFLGASSPEVRAEAANALAQALRGEPLPGVPAAQQEAARPRRPCCKLAARITTARTSRRSTPLRGVWAA